MRYLFILLVFLSMNVFSQDKDSHIIYNSKGKKVSYGKMLKELTSKNIVLFGELHNNAIAHWLQLELTKDLNTKRALVLGAEMIEADNQKALDMYLSGKIDSKGLDSLARLWTNFKTDYKPLVDFSKNQGIPFIATNIPRRYANMVYKGDFQALDTLSDLEKSWIAPMPIAFDPELPGYKNILEMMGDHGTPELVKAQAIKDATMAHFILMNRNKEGLFIHYNGAYHSNNYEGIIWYLNNEASGIEIGSISTVTQPDITKLDSDNIGLADFIICVDEDMTTTY